MRQGLHKTLPSQHKQAWAIYLLIIFALAHLSLDWHMKLFSHVMISALFWIAVLIQIWDKHHLVKPRFHRVWFPLSLMMVAGLIIFGFYRSSGNIVSFFPFVSFLSWIVGIYGYDKIRFYRKELLMLLCLGLPKFANDEILNIAPITAQAVFGILLYVGYTVVKQNLHICLPEGCIQVVPECSGLVLIIYMVSVSILFLGIFSLSRLKSCVLIVLAVLVGFIANAIRVAVLAVLSNPNSISAFKFWHSNQGASYFVLGAILSYALLSFAIIHLLPDRKLNF